MEFGSSKRIERKRRKLEAEVTYPCDLQLYLEAPKGEVHLREFDEFAFERLKVLRAVERLNLSGHIKNSEEWIAKLYEDFTKNKYFIIMTEKHSKGKSEEIQKARRQDHVSHYILRVAYCRTEELRRWFVAHETDLFKARFLHGSRRGTDIKNFLINNELEYKSITAEEKERERDKLLECSANVSGDSIDEMTFYKVPFTDALELIRQRKVYLKDGYAYVPEADLATLVTSSFRSSLSHAMALSYRALPKLDSDERMVHLLRDFDKRYTGRDFSNRKPEDACRITPDMIDALSGKSFPPCMRHLHDTLRTAHHLKYNGRVIYGLFLKAAGLNLEDALHFWRSHFLQNMDVETFDKRYSYGIRYNYGKEGKRTDFSPYGCMKIIMSAPGPADAHGCPFKHTEAMVLRQRLVAYRVSSHVIDDIMDLVSKNHFQIACQRYWEATHGVAIDAGINHPNQYFEDSQKYLNGGVLPNKVEKGPEVKTTVSVMYSGQSQPTNTNTNTNTTTTQDSMQDTTLDSTLDDSEMDMCFDDDLDYAMLDCMEG